MCRLHERCSLKVHALVAKGSRISKQALKDKFPEPGPARAGMDIDALDLGGVCRQASQPTHCGELSLTLYQIVLAPM